MFGPSRIYALDIETDTSGGYGLDPRNGGITEVAVIGDGGGVVFNDAHEPDLLANVNAFLASLPAGLVTTWNGSFFDLPFFVDRMRMVCAASDLEARGPVLTPDPGLVPKYEPLPGHTGGYSAVWQRGSGETPHQHLDVSLPYKKVAAERGVRWSLKPVCTDLGIDMVELDREQMHTYSWAERHDYVLSDVRGTRELALRLLGWS